MPIDKTAASSPPSPSRKRGSLGVTTTLAVTVLTILASGQAHADGGAGGGGAQGGVDNTGNFGNNGQPGSGPSAGGGGGGTGVLEGGAGGTGSSSSGGVGALGATPVGFAGSNGESGANGGEAGDGGGGGSGGVAGFSGTNAPSGVATGGNGGNGGNGISAGGGGGGAGAYGAVHNGLSFASPVAFAITGGNGGIGGNGTNGGSGGSGGTGLLFIGGDLLATINANVTGGNGGAGGTGTVTSGNGGLGGVGIAGNGVGLTINATVSGGLNGSGGTTPSGRAFALNLTGASSLTLGTNGQLLGGINIGTAPGTPSMLSIIQANAVTIDQVISGGGMLVINGPSTVTLTAANTYSGGTRVENGVLNIAGANSLPGGFINGATVFSGATLRFSNSSASTINGRLSGAGTVEIRGSAPLTLFGGTSLTGTLNVASGSSLVVQPSMFGSNAFGTLVNNGTVTLIGGGTFTTGSSGTGALILSGGSSMFSPAVLTGVHTHTGGTTVSNGSFVLVGASGGVADSLRGAITNNGTFGYGADATASGATITSSGSLFFSGSATAGDAQITLTNGSGSFTGNADGGTSAWTLQGSTSLDITQSTRAVGGGLTGVTIGSLSSSSASSRVSVGGYPELPGGPGRQLTIGSNDQSTTFAGIIQNGGDSNSGPGSLVKIGTGTLTLTGLNTYSGGTTINAGVLAVSADGNLGAAAGGLTFGGGTLRLNSAFNLGSTRAISLASGGGTIDTNGFNSVLSQGMTGAGGFRKIGLGNLTLTGASTYTGATTVSAGTLFVNGSLTSAVTVASGATLGGSGSVGALTVNGTLSPGNSPGTLTVNGNLTMSSGSVYLVEVLQGTADRTNVNGSAALNGTVRLVALGAPYTFGTPYVILAATGGLGGSTFSTVDSTTNAFGAGVRPLVTYTSNEVRLTLQAAELPTSTLINQRNVATGINAAVSGGANPDSFFPLFNLAAPAIPAALNTVSGEVYASANAIGFQVNDQFLRVMLDPFAAASSTTDADGVTVWAAPFGLDRDVDGDGTAIGSADQSLNTSNLAVGADAALLPNVRAGIAVSYGSAKSELSFARGETDADVLQVGGYATAIVGGATLGAALAYADMDVTSRRAIPVFGNAVMQGSYSAESWSVRVEGEVPVATLGNFDLSAVGAYRAISVDTPAFTERALAGSSFATLAVASNTARSSQAEIGAKLESDALFGHDTWTGYGQASWAHAMEGDYSATAALTGLSGSRFTVYAAEPETDTLLLRAGVSGVVSERVTVSARIESETGDGVTEVGGMLQARLRF